MNTNNILGGVLIGKLNLSIGCRQTRKLADASRNVSINVGAVDADGNPNGAVSVNAKLWRGSTNVMELQKRFVSATQGFNSMTLPWSKGVRIFRAEGVHRISDSVNNMIRSTDALIDEIVANYPSELEMAIIALGNEADRENYPEDGDEFRRGIIRRFSIDVLGESEKIVQLVGGALGQKLAAEHYDQMQQSLGAAQQDAADRLADILERFMSVCDPSKERTRVTDVLFEDLEDVTKNIKHILLFPNPALENVANLIRDRLSRFNRDGLSKNKHERQAAHREAVAMSQLLSTIPVV